EWVEARLEKNHPVVQRRFRMERIDQELSLALGYKENAAEEGLKVSFAVELSNGRRMARFIQQNDGLQRVDITPSEHPVEFRVALSTVDPVPPWDHINKDSEARDDARWRPTLSTYAVLSPAT